MFEHGDGEGEEAKLVLYNNELGVRCPLRVSSSKYEVFELDESLVGECYEECRMHITRHTHQVLARACCESRIVEAIPQLLKIKSAAHANELAAELSVATLISCGPKSYYVCVTASQKYLLSFNRYQFVLGRRLEVFVSGICRK